MANQCSRERLTVNQVIDIIGVDDSDFGDDDASDDEFDTNSWSDADDDEGSTYETEKETETDGDSSGDDVPLAQLHAVRQPVRKKNVTFKWSECEFNQPTNSFTGEPIKPTNDEGVTGTPLQYLSLFVTDEMIEMIVTQTNLYSAQKFGPNKCVKTNTKEILQFLGIYLRMGLVSMPDSRMYWESEIKYGPVCDVMTRNRFELLLGSLHFVDNNEIDDDGKKEDKLWKLRPFLTKLREQYILVTPTEHQSVDEQMVPYKGKYSGIRQYIKGKPHPWGFKVWCRCDATGILHDFDVYQGKSDAKSGIPLGSQVVLKLCESLASNCSREQLKCALQQKC